MSEKVADYTVHFRTLRYSTDPSEGWRTAFGLRSDCQGVSLRQDEILYALALSPRSLLPLLIKAVP